jgi:hypothetical protein
MRPCGSAWLILFANGESEAEEIGRLVRCYGPGFAAVRPCISHIGAERYIFFVQVA